MAKKKTVGIVGARGIGRHHANWWRLADVEVCGIVGTSVGSVVETAGMLQEMMGFSGQGYVDLGAMLEEQKPDFVDICSPDPFHAEQTGLALANGFHVLCEKPFVYDPDIPAKDLLAKADELLQLAADNDLTLGLCSQHYVTCQSCLRLYREQEPDAPLTSIEGTLASPAKGQMIDPDIIWSDLGPHMLAAVQAVAPDAEMDKDSIQVERGTNRFDCSFTVSQPNGDIACTLKVYKTEGEPTHVRRVILNGHQYDLSGGRGDDGIYYAQFDGPAGTHREEDPLRQTIRRMAELDPPMHGEIIRQNQQWLLEVIDEVPERSRRGH